MWQPYQPSPVQRPRPRPLLRQPSICGPFDPGSLIAAPAANRRPAISPGMFLPPARLTRLRNGGPADSTCPAIASPLSPPPLRMRPSPHDPPDASRDIHPLLRARRRFLRCLQHVPCAPLQPAGAAFAGAERTIDPSQYRRAQTICPHRSTTSAG